MYGLYDPVEIAANAAVAIFRGLDAGGSATSTAAYARPTAPYPSAAIARRRRGPLDPGSMGDALGVASGAGRTTLMDVEALVGPTAVPGHAMGVASNPWTLSVTTLSRPTAPAASADTEVLTGP